MVLVSYAWLSAHAVPTLWGRTLDERSPRFFSVKGATDPGKFCLKTLGRSNPGEAIVTKVRR